MDFYAETESLQVRIRDQSSLLLLCQVTISPTAKHHQKEACLLFNNLVTAAR